MSFCVSKASVCMTSSHTHTGLSFFLHHTHTQVYPFSYTLPHCDFPAYISPSPLTRSGANCATQPECRVNEYSNSLHTSTYLSVAPFNIAEM